MSMIAEFSNKEAVIVNQIDFLRKEIEFDICIADKPTGITIVLLYEEHNHDETERVLYGYQVGLNELQKPLTLDSDTSFDFELAISEELDEWFKSNYPIDFLKNKLGNDGVLQASTDYDDMMDKIVEIMQEENLV